MFQIDRKLILALAVSILIMFAGGYFVWQDLNSKYAVSITNKTNANNNASSTPEITVIPVPVNKKPVPTLSFPPEIKANLSEESRVMAINAIKEIIASIRENPNSESNWINLGLQRNFVGDFIGAKEAWEYASYLRPDDFIPQHNLGDLYTYSLNDYAKAEASYRKAIKLDPTQLIVYQKLYELYRFKVKDNAKAIAVLEEGISKNPATSLWLEKILDEFKQSI